MGYDRILERAAIFQELTSDDMELIGSISAIQTGNTGDVVFEEGSASDELYVIMDGEVDIQVDPVMVGEAATKSRVLITTLRRGQSFGEMALVSQNPRAATARCAQHDTSLIVIPRQRLALLCEEHPRLGYQLMLNLAADLARKMRTTDQLIQERVTWASVR